MQFTEFFITVNTNIKPSSESQTNQMTAILDNVLRKLMNSREGYTKILRYKPGTKLHSVTMMNFAVEIGKKMNRIHAHFNLSITHSNGGIIFRGTHGKPVGHPFYDPTTRNLRYFCNEIFPWRQGCRVQVDLLDTRAKNYNTKSAATRRSVTGRTVAPVLAINSGAGQVSRHGSGEGDGDQTDDRGGATANGERGSNSSRVPQQPDTQTEH